MNRREWIFRGSTGAAGALLVGATAPATLGWPPAARRMPNGTRADPIRLHSNENPFGPPEGAREAMVRAFDESWQYPSESYPALIEQVAATEGVSPDHVFLGAGSHEVLRTAGTAFGIAGGHLIAPFPTYEAFRSYSMDAGGIVERVPLTSTMETDLGGMEGAVTDDTTLVFICNPNNPTGRVVPEHELRAMLSRLDGRTTVLVDEAYHEYVDHPDYSSCVDLVREGHDIIVSRTFSKIFGLAGMRVGFAIAQPATVQRMMAFRNRHSISSVSIAAARAAYQDTEFVRFSREENAAGRRIVYAAAESLGMEYLESQGNYVFIHVGEPVVNFQRRMADRGIRVGRAFAPYTDWARISIGTRDEMNQFASALAKVADEVGQE